jgi:hypothetical protein
MSSSVYTFLTSPLVQVGSFTWQFRSVSVTLDDSDGVISDYHETLRASLDPGARIFTWFREDAPREPSECFECGGPFSNATGTVLGPKKTPFCGRCARDMMDWFHGHSRRQTALRRTKPKTAVRFYDHAGVPLDGKV